MYYNFDKLNGYYPQGYRIFIAVGEGGVGKTYSAMAHCANRLRKNKDSKILLVRDSESATDTFAGTDGIATLEKHFGKGIKIKDEEIWKGNRQLGRLSALSTFYKSKGLELATNGYDTIFFDEFIPESKQANRIDACRAFYRTLQTTLRTNKDAKIYMAANLITESALWPILGVYPEKPGNIYTNKQKGVVLEYVKPTEEWLKAHKSSIAGRLGIDDTHSQDTMKLAPMGYSRARLDRPLVFTNGGVSVCFGKMTKDGKSIKNDRYNNVLNELHPELHRLGLEGFYRFDPRLDKEKTKYSFVPCMGAIKMDTDQINNWRQLAADATYENPLVYNTVKIIFGIS